MVKALDGIKQGLAPRPPRNGLASAVWDVLDSWGEQSEDDVRKRLPAAMDDAIVRRLVTRKKVHQVLYYLVYHGFAVTHSDLYRVAPLSYYESRRAYIAELNEKAAGKPSRRRGRRRLEDDLAASEPRLGISHIIAAFVCGLAIGAAATGAALKLL